MNATENSNTCVTICWVLAALAGLGLTIGSHGALGIVLAVLLGLVVTVAGGALLQKTICGADLDNWGPFEGLKGVPGWDAPNQRSTDAPVAPTAPASQPAAKPAVAAPEAKVATSSTQLPGETELKARKGDWRYDPTPNGAADGPARLASARESGADDLKLIKGVGPKLESLLHEMGFYHFDQVAAWSEDDVAWMDENLEGFKGRVSRDAWVEQAKILAAGGETEFSKRNA